MTTIKGIDLSSNNPRSLSALGRWIAAGCQLAVIHSYHSGEAPGLPQTTREWIDLCRQAGLWCWPYTWLFRSFSASQATRESIELFRDADMPPNLIGLDCETYGNPVTDPGPTAEQILAACEQARSMGVEPILYSNKSWLDGMTGDHEILRGIPAWIANFSHDPALSVPAPDWVRVVGHQYSGDPPVDWSVWDLEALQALSGSVDPCAKLRTDLQAITAAKPYRAPSKAKLTALLRA